MKKIVVIIPCTEQKREAPLPELMAKSLPYAEVDVVANSWSERVKNSQNNFLSQNLYCGRSFQEAKKASEAVQADLLIISAGLGLVERGEEIPAYNLTVAPNQTASINTKITSANFTPAQWWTTLKKINTPKFDLKDKIQKLNPELILIALSENYSKLLFEELVALNGKLVAKVRIFGLGLNRHLPDNMKNNLLPYDMRLNGPDSDRQGTITDLASRAIRHFCENLQLDKINGVNLKDDIDSVEKLLKTWRYPDKILRSKQTDEEVIEFAVTNWEKVGGRSSAMLRLLRDEGLACEQSRFKDLFHEVRKKKEKQGSFML